MFEGFLFPFITVIDVDISIIVNCRDHKKSWYLKEILSFYLLTSRSRIASQLKDLQTKHEIMEKTEIK